MSAPNLNSKKVILGLSGGVDSSVSAFLLKEQGFVLEALFMKNWEEDDQEGYCASAQDLTDAESICQQLGLYLHKVNFAKEYWDKVFQIFLEEYENGRTPNPDILCNKEIKFRAFLDYALAQGADYIATGHYARKLEQDGRYYLLKGLDANKDQSYFLYALSEDQIAKVLFPVGELEKKEVRLIAQQQNFINQSKKDSTGICFIGEKRFKTFLSHYLPAKPGDIITSEGKLIGKHEGLMYYTIGQRKGIGIGGLKQAEEKAWYVAQKDLQNNRLIVVQGEEHPLLFKQSLLCSSVHWINDSPNIWPFDCQAKTRYRQADQKCTLYLEQDGRIKAVFEQAQRAITPGQSVVFYQGDYCLGGAIIDE